MFNNQFNSSKVDPLVEAVKQAQADGDLRRQAEALVNEAFGVYSRKAVVREELAEYDTALQSVFEELKGNQDAIDANKNKKIDAGDFKILRARKQKMDEEEQTKVTTKHIKAKDREGYINAGLKKSIEAGKNLRSMLDKDRDERKKTMKEGTAESETSMNVTKDNKPSTPAQTAASTSGPSASDKAGLNAKIKAIKESVSRKKDIAKGGVTAPQEFRQPALQPNPGALPLSAVIKEAWKRLKEAKKEMKEARKCMGEEFDSFDYSNLNEAYANYIAEAINEYGAINEHPVATVENLHMFNEAYVAAVLAEAEKCECEKAEKYEKAAKKHDKHKKMAKTLKKARKDVEKESDEKELDEAKKWIQSAIKRPGALSRKLGVPEEKNIPASKLKVEKGDTAQTKKQKVLAKTLKHLARKKKMQEELQLDELSAFGKAFQAAGGKNFTFQGKSYSGARADGRTPAARASAPGTQGVATGKSFDAIDKAQAAKAKSGPADNPGLRGASPAMPKTPGTVARDTGVTGKPGGETGVTSGSTVSLDRAGNVGASPGAAPSPAPKTPAAPTGPTPTGAKPTASSGLVGPDASKMMTPERPAPAAPVTSQPGAPKDDASAGVKKLMSMSESVQVGDNKYRIV